MKHPPPEQLNADLGAFMGWKRKGWDDAWRGPEYQAGRDASDCHLHPTDSLDVCALVAQRAGCSFQVWPANMTPGDALASASAIPADGRDSNASDPSVTYALALALWRLLDDAGRLP